MNAIRSSGGRLLQSGFQPTTRMLLLPRTRCISSTREFGATLAKAFISGTLVDTSSIATHNWNPASVEDAEAVQHEMLDMICAALPGEATAIIGWKAGATNLEVQRTLGLDSPFLGPILSSQLYHSPAELTPSFRVRGVEAEYCFRMARSLPPRDVDYSEIEVFDAVCPAIEVCGSRLSAPPTPGPGAALLSIADQASHGALVLAEQHRVLPSEWRAMTAQGLKLFPVSLSVNGTVLARGDGTAVLGNPLHSLVWVVNNVLRRADGEDARRGVQEGSLITTGTMTGLTPIPPASSAASRVARVVAEFTGFGRVKVALSMRGA